MSLSITRNGITKVLNKFKLVKGKKKDAEYLSLSVDFSSDESWAAEVTFAGRQLVAGILQTFYKRVGQDIYFDNIQDDGTLNESKFLEEMSKFDQSGMKLKEIKDKLEEAQATLGQRVMSASPADFANPEWQVKSQEIGEYINMLRSMAEARSRKKPEAEEEPEPSVAVA